MSAPFRPPTAGVAVFPGARAADPNPPPPENFPGYPPAYYELGQSDTLPPAPATPPSIPPRRAFEAQQPQQGLPPPRQPPPPFQQAFPALRQPPPQTFEQEIQFSNEPPIDPFPKPPPPPTSLPPQQTVFVTRASDEVQLPLPPLRTLPQTRPDAVQQQPKKSRKKLYLIILGVVLLLLALAGAGVGLYFGLRGSGSESGTKTTPYPPTPFNPPNTKAPPRMNKILILGGGGENSDYQDTILSYTPSDSFLLSSNDSSTLQYSGIGGVAGLLGDSKVIVKFGYYTAGNRTSTAVQMYDLNTGNVTLIEPYPDPPLLIFNGVSTGERLYLCGGIDTSSSNEPIYSACNYIDESLKWINIAPMVHERYGHAMATLYKHLYAISGSRSFGTSTSVERYNEATGQWQEVASLVTGSTTGQAVAFEGKVLFCGGYIRNGKTSTPLSRCVIYNPATDSWSSFKSMLKARYQFSLVNYNGVVYAIGGSLTYADDSVEYFDPRVGDWKEAESLSHARWIARAVAVP